MKYDSVILDIDGTIWNTTEIVSEAWNEAIKTYFPQVPLVSSKILQQQFGKTMKVIADNLFTSLSDDEKNFLMKKCCEMEQKYLHNNVKDLTYPGVIEGIQKLSEQIPVFIVSNCQDGYIEVVIEKNGISEYITDFECYGKTGLDKSENIKLIIKRNNLMASVYVGDTKGDEEACKAAGIPFIWASYGFGLSSDFIGKLDSFEDIFLLIN